MKYLLVPALLLIGLAFGACSGSEATSCSTTDDCFSGEYCDDGICIENSASNAASNTPNENNNGSSANGSSNTGENSSTVNDNNDSNDINDDEPSPECSLSDSEALNCDSGHSELNSDSIRLLHPDEIEAAGCEDFWDFDSFVRFDSHTTQVTACPFTDSHTFHLVLNECREQPYTAYLRIEPLTPSCGLDEYASLELETQSGTTDMRCGELDRDYSCYLEKSLPNGGMEWTLRTNNSTTSNNIPWYITLDVENPRSAHFEYQITTEIDPLPDN